MTKERDAEIKDSISRSIKNAEPDWVLNYLMLARVFLMKQKYVEGGEFKKFCVRRKLWKPDTHNRWVGMPQHLQKLGWIEPIGKLEPTTTHSHIEALTFWRSRLFDEEKVLHNGIPSQLDTHQSQHQDRADSGEHDGSEHVPSDMPTV